MKPVTSARTPSSQTRARSRPNVRYTDSAAAATDAFGLWCVLTCWVRQELASAGACEYFYPPERAVLVSLPPTGRRVPRKLMDVPSRWVRGRDAVIASSSSLELEDA